MTLTPKGYRPRLVDSKIDEYMRIYGAVSIEGTKNCGKTWTARNHSNSIFALDDASENYRNYRLASRNANYALEGEEPHLIDEWQTVPSIWDGVRRRVDEEKTRGRFVLCRSSVPPENGFGGSPMHSGLGRIGAIRMRTMSLYESGDSDGAVSLKGLFDSDFKNSTPRTVTYGDLVRLVMRGGWPSVIDAPFNERLGSMPGYIDRLCERDLPRVDRSKNPYRMKMVLRSLSRNESMLASNSAIARDMKENDDETIKDTTVSDYISTLERMYLIENQPSYSSNLRSSERIGKKPKRHLTDPAIAVSALGLTSRMLDDDEETFGFLFEGMCERDLQIYAEANGGNLFHYNDGRREIDAIVEMPDRRWGAFEIKVGTSRIDSAAENLIKTTERMEKFHSSPSFLCVLCGTESAAYRREDGVYVVPVTRLKN